MAAPGDIEQFLEFVKARVHMPDDIETMADVLEFMREGTTLMGHTSGPPEIVEINMHEKQNAKTNHTEAYKAVYGEYPFAVLRRGNVFKVGIRFNQFFELGNVPLQAIFKLGASPSESDGTLVTLTAPHAVDQEGKAHETVDRWTMSVSFHNNDIMLLKFRTPAKAPVGRWSLSFRLGDGSASPAKTPIYIICNPWLPEDPVYLKDEAERNFYTMKETGAYYYGSEKNFGQREWNYGQFEKVTLATVEFLLKAVVADGVQRSDCVSLVRALCAAINVQDDQGLLIGRWSDDYSAGTSPSVWSSTMPILNKYMESGGNSVKYGQCFVFASALVTVLRALGIPSRSVSNFPSAHVEGDDMSLDFYFDEKNKAIEGADMEWNFHVWTEAWMARPDLPTGYGGWQAVDSTPQIVSEGMYKVGPYPVKAIRENRTDLKHDGKYLSASVKAVYRYHKKDPSHPKGWKLVYEKNNMCGRLILTEKFNPNGGRLQPDDITHTYKGPAAQPRGATTDLIQVRLEHEKLVPVGQSGRVLCTITNNDLEEHRVGLALTAYSAPYSNVRPNALVSAQRDFCLQAGSSDALELLISPECYVSKLCPEGMILLEAVATYGNDFTTARSNLAVQMPQLEIQVSRKETPVGALAYKLTMKNPLNVALSNCELTVELPGSTAFLEKIALK
ncbi:hemocyte protein-glutamine gamma-glutamyltransferase [Rhipicephalus microplus]|uniref:hemocyte protein-glutamine gamma-glutamyltransferase n=1 Tax=Rhipicephalus microplus TaxID=6941 RepID=UPI003F6C6E87